MKLHASVVEKIMYMVKTYSGYQDESKLRKMIENIDVTPYDRKSTGETILVLTEEFINKLNNRQQ
jgi:hypothetical protein